MLEILVHQHGQFLIVIYFGAICLIAITESIWPRRSVVAPMRMRWFCNITINLLDVAVVRLFFPFLMVGAALWAESIQLGLFNQWQVLPAVAFILALVLLDAVRYAQHYLLHQAPWLWRLHRVHHTDQDYDFSTGLRFHPIEAMFTNGLDILIVILLGLPPTAVAAYSLFNAAWAIFAHSNVRLPTSLDRVLRVALVTPDLHRTHHSAEPGECMTNFGGVTPLWDHLFGTYQDQPAKGHTGMTIGLPGYEHRDELRLDRMLSLPFLKQKVGNMDQSVHRIVPND